MLNVLVLGGGFTASKRLNDRLHFSAAESMPKYDKQIVTTIDQNKECNPTWVWNLNNSPWPVNKPIHPRTFDEVHAYEVLEHLGTQGDAWSLFQTFANIWWALKPGGLLFASVPSYKSIWAFGDPTHTRIINAGTLTFLRRDEYEKQLGKTSMSDYRHLLVGDWEMVSQYDDGESFRFVMRAK